MRLDKSLVLAASASLLLTTGVAMAQTADQGGPNTGTSTLAGPGQKAGADNANGRTEGRSATGGGMTGTSGGMTGTSNAGGNPSHANGGNGPGGRY